MSVISIMSGMQGVVMCVLTPGDASAPSIICIQYCDKAVRTGLQGGTAAVVNHSSPQKGPNPLKQLLLVVVEMKIF